MGDYKIKFSILITTYNRVDELRHTLKTLRAFIKRYDTEVIVCDDASMDGTSRMILENYPDIVLIKNKENKGLIYNRNLLHDSCSGEFMIMLDDDANFLMEKPLESIELFFNSHSTCGVQAFKIYWTKNLKKNPERHEEPYKIREFVGCGHAWRKSAWQEIREYPAWFEFYGEETFASLELFKSRWDVCLNPSILIQHRVDLIERRTQGDFSGKRKLALRAGWFIYYIFYPLPDAIKMHVYSMWAQLKNHGLRSIVVIMPAFFGLFKNAKKVMNYRNPLSKAQLKEYRALNPNKIYW